MGSSILYPGELLIDDDTPAYVHAPPEGKGTGRSYEFSSTRGYGSVAAPFPTSLLIPQSEWQARIAEMEAEKSRLSDIVNAAGLPPKDQAQTNYCWCNAIVEALEVVRVVQNQQMTILSPASVGGPITGYRNRGGLGPDALQYVVANGAVPVSLWPANAISSQYATPAAKAAAMENRVVDWIELDNSTDQIVSLLLRRIGVCVGLDWWGHEVMYYDAVWLNGAIAVRFRNSWGSDWPTSGAGGWSTLQGRKITPSDSVAPLTALAT